MKIKIEKPIAFFDVETTGLDLIKDRIIEISIIKLLPDGTREKYYSRVNPEDTPINPGAIEKHGITFEDLREEPTFKEVADEIFNFMEGCDLGGYNIVRFDIPILVEEFIRLGKYFNPRKSSILDSYMIYTKMEPRNLEGAYKYYTGNTLENAHSAEADISATVDIFEAQLEKYDLESVEAIDDATVGSKNNVDLAGKFQKSEEGLVVITFGKHKGKSVANLYKDDPGYFEWIAFKSEMPSDTKIIAKKILEKLSAK